MVVARYTDTTEANVALARLRFEDLPAMLASDNAGGAYLGLEVATGIRLLVRTADEAEARSILELGE